MLMKDICRGDDEHFQLCLYSARCLKLFLKREKCNFDNLTRITCIHFPLGINYIDRTTEDNCLDVYYCYYPDDFCYYYILAA